MAHIRQAFHIFIFGILFSTAAQAEWPQIGGDVGRIWEQGKKDVGNAASAVEAAAKVAVKLGTMTACPLCAIALNQVNAKDRETVEAIASKGLIISVAGPVIGTYVITTAAKEETRQTSVRRVPSAPSGKEVRGSLDCLVQYGDRVEGYSIKKPDFASAINRGDRLILTAPLCGEYGKLGPSVQPLSSSTIILEGMSEDGLAKEGELKYTFVGKAV